MSKLARMEKEMIKRRASMVFHGHKKGMTREEVMEYAMQRHRDRNSLWPTFDTTVDMYLDSLAAFRKCVREAEG